MTLAVDASGIKVANRGEWMRQRWRMRRGFLKIHIVVDVEMKQIVTIEITDDRTGNGKVLKPLVEQIEEQCRVVKVIADGAYDSSSNFSFLEEWEIEPVIRVRNNSSRRARSFSAKKRVVMEQLRDRDRWKRWAHYSFRWMTKTALSVFEQLFGEHVIAKRFSIMARELLLKVFFYNLFMRLSHAPSASCI